MARRIEPSMDASRRTPAVSKRARPKGKSAKGRMPARAATNAARQDTRKGTRKNTRKDARRDARRARRAARPWPLRALGFLVYWGMIAGLWGGVAVAGIVVYYGARLPAADTWAVPAREPVVTFVAADGDTLAQRGWTDGGTGAALTLDEMSPWLPAALIAIEDRRFRSHFGLDPIGFTRAMVENVRAGRMVQGGSTITQQLAKNVFLTGERSIERKVQELLLAFWLERRHTKDRILELYLNRVYFGHGTQGVEAASRRYFGHGAAELTLMEAAILAGSLKAPSRLNPESHPRDSAARAALVLAAMREQGVITAEQEAAARSTPPSSAPAARRGAMPWAVDAAMRELKERVPGIEGDVTVHTTIVPAFQRSAAVALSDAIATTESKGGDQGAIVLMDGTGAIRAIVGGRDYRKSQFDRATRARRQPGSAFKAFTFLAALEKGLEPGSQAYDEPVEIEGWSPKNYDGRYRGPVTLEEAFAQSLNTVAAQIVAYVGSSEIKAVAERMGVRTELSDNLSLSLGTSEVTPLELTLAYAPFANGGRAPEAHLIERVEGDATLYERPAVADPQVIDAIAYAQMSGLLRAVVERGTGVKARIPGVAVGGKTGTSQNYRDAWFVGVVPSDALRAGPGWVASVWIGADDGKPMKGVTGGSAPASAWARLMASVLDGTEIAPTRPEDAIALPTYGPPPRPRPAQVAMPYATESRAAR